LEALKQTKNTQQHQELQELAPRATGTFHQERINLSGFECDPGSQKKLKNTQLHQVHASGAEGLIRI
jgi:hypothetical protein